MGGDVPEVFKKEPKACLGRNIATPDGEFLLFLEYAKKLKLHSVCIEYLNDKFVAKSLDKYYLGKLLFFNGKGKNGGDKINSLGIINFGDTEGEKFNNIKTLWCEKLINFHHDLCDSIVSQKSHVNFDASKWFTKKSKNAVNFYVRYLGLFICHGVLFEDYVTNNEEKRFVEKIVLPNLKKIIEIFRIKPLVVQLSPHEKKSTDYWWCYPESTKKFLNILVFTGGNKINPSLSKIIHQLHS